MCFAFTIHISSVCSRNRTSRICVLDQELDLLNSILSVAIHLVLRMLNTDRDGCLYVVTLHGESSKCLNANSGATAYYRWAYCTVPTAVYYGALME